MSVPLTLTLTAAILLGSQSLLYPPSDPARDIAAALQQSRADQHHVLIDFGADWCPDCRVLGKLFEDPAVAPFLAANFHVVHVDVGRRDKNADVVAKYGASSGDWIPAIVVLAADGTVVARTNDEVRLTRRTTPAELLARLQEWAPKQRWLELGSSTERGVQVSIALERDTAGLVWLAARFAPTVADTHLYATALPDEGLDGIGRPTRLAIVPSRGLTALGEPSADRPVELDRIDALGAALPIYPAGPVTLRVPVSLARGARTTPAVVDVSYMACSPKGCLAPVLHKRTAVSIPGQ
ncbi:MAG TPA: thioredoxin family protein [Vicinamibacterales bacterium]|nr:thioredoxin family protein [Vicinamibacterales bacterium]